MKIFFLIIALVSIHSSICYTQGISDSTTENLVISPPPPPPPPTECEEAEPFVVVEQMPRFVACEDLNLEKKQLQQCANKALLEFVYHHLKYPKIAEENNIKGTVVIQFTVEKTGQVIDAKIVKDIGGNCGEEGLRIVNLLPDFLPGKQRGRPVHVTYNLPIVFGLE